MELIKNSFTSVSSYGLNLKKKVNNLLYLLKKYYLYRVISHRPPKCASLTSKRIKL